MNVRFGFSKRIMLLLVSMCIFTILIISYLSISLIKDMSYDQAIDNLNSLTDSTYNQIDSAVNASIKNYLRAIAENNLEIIEEIYSGTQSGEVSEADSKKLVKELLNSQTIGETGYIYIVDSDGVLQVHPFIAGQNLNEYAFIKDQIKQKEGYLEYIWKNPFDATEREKVLYMTYFEPWDYIISISTYKSEFSDLVNVSDFKANILSMPVGETGYIYVMDSAGKLIIHPKQEDVNILDSEDLNGHRFIEEIIKTKKAASFTHGSIPVK